jgi:superfamily II DNA helicase RecQ
LTTEPDPARTVSSHAPDVEPPRSASRRRADPSGELDDDATARFEALRSLRNELRDGKPAYVVFDNKTLAAIADRAPTTKADLAKISGVGPAKLERYGDAVIGLISELLR